MSARRGVLAGGLTMLAILAGALLLSRNRRPTLSGPQLLVYGSVDRSFSRVDIESGEVKPVGCVELPRWLLNVGKLPPPSRILVALDTEKPAIVRIDLDALLDRRACKQALERTPIARGRIPNHGAFVGDRLVVSFFGEDEVAIFGDLASAPRELQTVKLDGGGASAVLAAQDGAAWVSSVGMVCKARECPSGRYGASTLDRIALQPAASTQLARVDAVKNGAGLYRHPAGGATFWLFAGEIDGGTAAVVPLDAAGGARAPLLVPTRGVSVRAGYPLTASTAALLGFSGTNITLLDVRTPAIKAIWRYEDHRFVDVTNQPAIDERSDGNFRDLVALDQNGGRYFLLDGRGDRLIEARFLEPARFELAREIPLGTKGTMGASWAEWL